MTLATLLFPEFLRCRVRTVLGNIHIALIVLEVLAITYGRS